MVDRLYQGLAYDIDTGISRAIRDGQLSAVAGLFHFSKILL